MKPTSKRIIVGASMFALGAPLLFHFTISFIPLPPELFLPPKGPAILVDRHGRRLASLPLTEARAQVPISLTQMGEWLPIVTVALEDHRFYDHSGIDLHALAGALRRNIRAGRIVSGASTITQQLIKLASKRKNRSWWAKLYENMAALRLERMWSKDRILEEYLNRSHYANRQIGPAAAARAYFNKAPYDLTPSEAVYLSGLPQAPTRFNPRRHAEAAAIKYQRSVCRLEKIGFGSTDGVTLPSTPPQLASFQSEARLAGHFVDAVRSAYPKLSGGRVKTTLDLDLQRMVEKELQIHLAKLAGRQVNQGAVVVLDTRSGAIRAMVGSGDYAKAIDGQINGSTIFRSCGSTLKPFLYLQAIEDRVLTAASLLPDTPDAVRDKYLDYDPVNYDKRFLGPVRVREALANSLNVPAVVALSRLGARKMFSQFKQCGLNFAGPFDQYGAGLILGNAEVRLLDLTAAFSVFSGHSLAVQPRFLEATPVRHRFVASSPAVAIVGDILSDNQARRKTFGPFSPLAFENKRIPCKTGTSSGFRDAWAVGVTAEHAVGVWVGNFDGRPMDEIAAITGAVPLWRGIIDYLLWHGDSGVSAPAASSNLVRANVCELTGLLPVPESPGVINEFFLTGTQPTESANRYLHRIDKSVRLFLPPEYDVWCRSAQNHIGAQVQDNAPLKIVVPAANASFIIARNLPRSQQALRLLAAGNSVDDLAWSVDGTPVPRSNGGYFWHLREGRHTVHAANSKESASAEFVVQ
ncbi:MAG TPA: penicillin-binding protein 1C [Chthoniobacterales bacterium]|nr:penicillin-binding protein 1C [Chthoniobacterales bacterium]